MAATEPRECSPAVTAGVAAIHRMRRVRREIGQDHRYGHTLRVARFAERLAFAHGEDPQRARIAGLYHDLARLYSAERLIDECTRRGLSIDRFERANPIVLHARLGAELAREEHGVGDPAILSAIAKHTVAAAEMSRLDIILYLADGLEPGRDFAERAAFADLARRDLEAAMQAVLGSTLAYLEHRGLEPAPQMLAAAHAFGVPAASVSSHDLESSRGPQPERLSP